MSPNHSLIETPAEKIDYTQINLRKTESASTLYKERLPIDVEGVPVPTPTAEIWHDFLANPSTLPNIDLTECDDGEKWVTSSRLTLLDSKRALGQGLSLDVGVGRQNFSPEFFSETRFALAAIYCIPFANAVRFEWSCKLYYYWSYLGVWWRDGKKNKVQ